MSHPNILITQSDGIVTIEISRREKKNAITSDMYRAMSAALSRARDDSHVRVVLLRGQEDMFTAGNDLADFLQRKVGDPSTAIPFLHLIAGFEKPIVGAVAGNAVGIGTTMLLHCDLVYAATAREAGFVNRVLPASELMGAAMQAAQKLAARPAGSLAVTKALLKRPPDRSAIEAIDEEVIFFGDLVAAPAAKEIFAAFLEKRSPDPAKLHDKQ